MLQNWPQNTENLNDFENSIIAHWLFSRNPFAKAAVIPSTQVNRRCWCCSVKCSHMLRQTHTNKLYSPASGLPGAPCQWLGGHPHSYDVTQPWSRFFAVECWVQRKESSMIFGFASTRVAFSVSISTVLKIRPAGLPLTRCYSVIVH